MEIRKILDILEAAPPQAGAVGAFGKDPNVPPGAAATPAAAPAASASPSGGGAVAAFGKTAMANAPGGTTSPAAPAAPAAPAPKQNTAAPASAGGYAQSAQPAAAAPAAARPDVEAQKKGMFATAAAQPVNNQSSGMTAQSQAQDTKAASAQATAPTSSGYTAQSQAQKPPPAAPTASPGAAAAMASKSAPAAPTAAPAAAPASAGGGFQGGGYGSVGAGSQTATAAAAPAAAPAQTSDQIATAALNAPDQGTSGASLGIQGGFGKIAEEENLEEELEEDLEEELAEAFNDMLRLSGLLLNEKAVSKQQQKFMGMAHAMQKGERVKGASPELKKVAKGMSKKDTKDFASTKHKGLPRKVNESLKTLIDEEGHTLEHIVNRFKYEAKNFLNTGEMSDKLYDALYDYYVDRGDMPYGIAKAREGDPYTWVAARFEADIDGTVDVKMPMGEVAGDDTLQRLAELAGLKEGMLDDVKTTIDKAMLPKAMHADYDRYQAQKARKEYYKKPYVDDAGTIYGPEGNPESMPSIRAKDLFDPEPNRDRDMFAMASGAKPAAAADKVDLPSLTRLKEDELTECGDMDIEQPDSFNVSTNMNSNGTKSVNISAQGDRADDLLQMLKMAGMRPHDDHDHSSMSEPEVIMIGGNDEMMEQELEEARKKRITRYVNTPDEEYQTVASITRQGNDLNREKKQFAGKPRLGDNPMAESALDADLDAMLESILVREEEKPTWLQRQPSKSQEEIAQDWKARGEASKDYVIPAERPYKDEKTGRMITPPRGATNPPPDSEFPPGDPRNSRPLKSKGK